MLHRVLLFITLVITSVLLIAGCGSNAASASTAATGHASGRSAESVASTVDSASSGTPVFPAPKITTNIPKAATAVPKSLRDFSKIVSADGFHALAPKVAEVPRGTSFCPGVAGVYRACANAAGTEVKVTNFTHVDIRVALTSKATKAYVPTPSPGVQLISAGTGIEYAQDAFLGYEQQKAAPDAVMIPPGETATLRSPMSVADPDVQVDVTASAGFYAIELVGKYAADGAIEAIDNDVVADANKIAECVNDTIKIRHSFSPGDLQINEMKAFISCDGPTGEVWKGSPEEKASGVPSFQVKTGGGSGPDATSGSGSGDHGGFMEDLEGVMKDVSEDVSGDA